MAVRRLGKQLQKVIGKPSDGGMDGGDLDFEFGSLGSITSNWVTNTAFEREGAVG